MDIRHEGAAMKDEYIKLLEKGFSKDQITKFVNDTKKGPDKVQDMTPKNKTSAEAEEDEAVLQDNCTPSKTAAKSNPDCIMTEKALTGFDGNTKDLNEYLKKKLSKIASDMLIEDRAASLLAWIQKNAKKLLSCRSGEASKEIEYGNLNDWIWNHMESSNKASAHTAASINPMDKEFVAYIEAIQSNSDFMKKYAMKSSEDVEKEALPFFMKKAVLALAEAVTPEEASPSVKLTRLASALYDNALWVGAKNMRDVYTSLYRAVTFKNHKKASLEHEGAAMKDEYIKLLEKGFTKDQLTKFVNDEKKGPEKTPDMTPKNKTSADQELDSIAGDVEAALHRDQKQAGLNDKIKSMFKNKKKQSKDELDEIEASVNASLRLKKAFDDAMPSTSNSYYSDSEQSELSEEPMFLVSKTFETVTPESAENGDTEDSGFEFEDQEMSPYDLEREINNSGFYQWSNSSGGGWLITNPEVEDYSTGEEKSYGLHIKRMDGSDLTQEDIDFIDSIMK